MKRVWSILFTLIFSLSLLIPPTPTQAQAETPPPPAAAAQGQEPAVPQAASGPATSKFGYKRKAVPVEWLDVKTNGTQINIHDRNDTVPMDLGFNFNFYDQYYNQTMIDGGGHLEFERGEFYGPGMIPTVTETYPFIAPYMFGAEYTDPWGGYIDPEVGVYTMSGIWPTGTEAGLKYTAVEWYRVQDSDDNTYTFEVILFENGTILFQYEDMLISDDYSCAFGGIMNNTGDSLVTLRSCTVQKSNTAWKITRPQPSVRISIPKLYQGGLTNPGSPLKYRVVLRNSGDLGPDTFDITASSRWPVTFFAADGVTPLTDTDGDGKVDTGAVPIYASTALYAHITIPNETPIGAANTSKVTFRSSLNRKKSVKITLVTAAANQFTLAFDGDNGSKIFQAAADQQNLSDALTGSNIQQLIDGSYLQLIHPRKCLDEECLEEYTSLEYTLVGQDGIQSAPIVLTDFEKDTHTFVDIGPVAPLADGRIGVLFLKIKPEGGSLNDFNREQSISLGIINLNPGSPVWTEVNLTGAETFFCDVLEHLSLAATTDNRFVAVWTHQEFDYDTYTYKAPNIWGASVSADGQVVTPAALLEPEPGNYAYSHVIPLQNGGVSIQWVAYLSGKPAWGAQVYVSSWSSGLEMWVAPRKIAKFQSGNLNAVQLPNGKILLVWSHNGNFKNNRYQYTLLNPDTLARTSAIHTLKIPFQQNYGFLSGALSYDAAGDGVLIWQANSGDGFSDLFYTRISARNGAVLTKTMPIAAGLESYNISNFGPNSLTTNLVP